MIARPGALFTVLASVILLTACSAPGVAPPTIQPSAQSPGSATSAPAPPAGAALPATSRAAAPQSSFPDPSKYAWVRVVNGLVRPVDIQFPDDGTGRMFILEQPGRVRIFERGQLVSQPYLDITSQVGSGGNEQGLLGLAFHPDFKDHPYFYVNYTDLDGNTVIARFQGSGDSADRASEKIILQVAQPFPNHNGGGMVFGPDGYLYIGLGDGGSAGDPYGNGQNQDVLLGKILRIDVDHGDPYAIPAGNPFADGGGRPEVWAYGLRNPWRFSFGRGTNDLYIGDVGQDKWEEVDVAAGNPPGLDFGWNYFEGNHPYVAQAPSPNLNLTMPVAEYNHDEGRCAIIGGYVYSGQMPEWRGVYFYGDECSGQIWGLRNSSTSLSSSGWSSEMLFRNPVGISSFGQDPTGEIYLAGLGGSVFQLQKLP